MPRTSKSIGIIYKIVYNMDHLNKKILSEAIAAGERESIVVFDVDDRSTDLAKKYTTALL